MAIEIKKVNDNYGIFNGYNTEFLRWQDLWFDRNAVKNYLMKNPFPNDDLYSMNDFLTDLKAEGSIIIPSSKSETAEYICGLISHLIRE